MGKDILLGQRLHTYDSGAQLRHGTAEKELQIKKSFVLPARGNAQV